MLKENGTPYHHQYLYIPSGWFIIVQSLADTVDNSLCYESRLSLWDGLQVDGLNAEEGISIRIWEQ